MSRGRVDYQTQKGLIYGLGRNELLFIKNMYFINIIETMISRRIQHT